MVERIETRAEGSAAQFTEESILQDYRIACRSREASLLGRREVFSGKAKFGIFGDGKEVAQLALARACRPGDIRSGYYRDQTLLMALGLLTVEDFFAQLYADPDPKREPCSAGRQMTAHFATSLLDDEGNWKNLLESVHSSADVSPTGSQMPRLVGLAYASRLYRQVEGLSGSGFSDNGNEVAFGTIGNATCAEGLFWESINAAGVLRAPMLLSIWDDGYGISVPNEFQVTKGNMTELLRGFRRAPGEKAGFDIYTVKGWDYPGLCETYLNAAEIVRLEHVPAIVHVPEMTQPQGHSTSGSHERYKSAERLAWEEEFDCIRQMRLWMSAQGLATESELAAVEEEETVAVRASQRSAWEAFRASVDSERRIFDSWTSQLLSASRHAEEVRAVERRLERQPNAMRRDLMSAATDLLILTRDEDLPEREEIVRWRRQQLEINRERYGSDLYSATAASALAVAVVPAEYPGSAEPEEPGMTNEPPAATAEMVRGFEVLNACFDQAFARHSHLIAFGQDLGRLGDVNQGMTGMQEKYGELRVSDTGIREATIIGQAIGLAMRGIRPIAEIQYLDYVLYGLQIMSDDLATVRWRTRGGQCAPVIVRTRGHRLEGVWHSGSPMAGVLNLIRGMYFCVPRNMTQAAGMYNTLLESDDPAIVVEVLNAYRAKERMPSNSGEFTVPLGVPEVLRDGADVTLVTYGACCKIALEAADVLATTGIEVEVVDVQTLLPFDGESRILESIQKTNRVVFVDEDVPGGATAYMMQKVLVEQDAFQWLDAEPLTISAKAHRPPYGSDGDYFSKPNRDQIFQEVYGLMHRSEPAKYPEIL